MSPGKILAIDDEQNIRHLIESEFTLEGYEVKTARDGQEGLKLLDNEPFDVVLLDIKLPRMNGIEVLRRVKKRCPAPEVLMITGYGDIKTAVESLKLGAREYITKPFKLDELQGLVKRAIADSADEACACTRPERVKGGDKGLSSLRCPSRSMRAVYDLVEKAAPTDSSILIQGETGAGKDVLASQIHSASFRRHGPLVTIDCGLLNKNLAESELYGHGKGAFSGAGERKTGLVEQSHGGSLFLDEIGNIDMELQKKFLRFLETRKFRRVGETREVEVDTRLILATNMDLSDAVHRGAFREDLFYRMGVIDITIPPLRNRPEDIECLVSHFLKTEHRGLQATMHPETLQVLRDYSWPGNVRELRSVINKAMIFAVSGTIMPEHLPSQILANRKAPPRQLQTLEELEKDHIIEVLDSAGGNQSKAAEILGINRKTLYKKLHKHKVFP
ncbi:MAG: sigma-54 dependent transcriptional regulator [Syntrophobacteraceae bacterium]|nr:sigma-54 dependent transcriptional regulator [Syntrophobacteraceae bacterium]